MHGDIDAGDAVRAKMMIATGWSVAVATVLLASGALLIFVIRAEAREGARAARAALDEQARQRQAATARLALILQDEETVPGVLWSEHDRAYQLPQRVAIPRRSRSDAEARDANG